MDYLRLVQNSSAYKIPDLPIKDLWSGFYRQFRGKACGTNKCTPFVQGGTQYEVEFWCKGSYDTTGTCSGAPTSVRIFEPTFVDNTPCDNEDANCKCGPGSYISFHSVCTDGTHGHYGVYCQATDSIQIKGFLTNLNCCVTCDPNPPVLSYLPL
jgi:hypothetical protein